MRDDSGINEGKKLSVQDGDAGRFQSIMEMHGCGDARASPLC
jgi:hypothetical protein